MATLSSNYLKFMSEVQILSLLVYSISIYRSILFNIIKLSLYLFEFGQNYSTGNVSKASLIDNHLIQELKLLLLRSLVYNLKAQWSLQNEIGRYLKRSHKEKNKTI